MTAAPEVTSTDVANVTAGNVTDGVVRHDVWLDTSQVTTDGCDRPADPLQPAEVACCPEEALLAACGDQR
jgi:hypothetical protein